MKRLVAGTLILTGCAVLFPSIASARPPYRMAFIKHYDVKADSNIGKAGCNLCHMGDDKKVRNPYGKELEKALGKTQATPDEATAAIKKAETVISPDKKNKYVDLIKADKLPGAAKPE
jgi:hypothetical protein